MSEKVLLIDDDQDFVDLLTEEMLYRDMDVFTAVSPEAAFKMIASDTFDVIVLSLMISGKSGLNILKNIKRINPYPEIIVLTDNTTVEKGIKAMKLGTENLLDKTMDISILAEKISRSLMKKMLFVEKSI
ncbi:Two component system response regulator [Desulfonema limicola]|uniref:Two component system response regulator n=1 Tax=Desulfonema limicola TaxID=45656 RepID=A0A975GIU6_9BACT|nr:response regulator [Desulfonema limicola]QTA82932.1 Two component system response regulator [Desulfonema limicola]